LFLTFIFGLDIEAVMDIIIWNRGHRSPWVLSASLFSATIDTAPPVPLFGDLTRLADELVLVELVVDHLVLEVPVGLLKLLLLLLFVINDRKFVAGISFFRVNN
jgi:hypothetical protein